MFAGLENRIVGGEQLDCIINGLVKDNLSETEIHGTCKTLLQAALDSTALSVCVAIGWLLMPTGYNSLGGSGLHLIS